MLGTLPGTQPSQDAAAPRHRRVPGTAQMRRRQCRSVHCSGLPHDDITADRYSVTRGNSACTSSSCVHHTRSLAAKEFEEAFTTHN